MIALNFNLINLNLTQDFGEKAEWERLLSSPHPPQKTGYGALSMKDIWAQEELILRLTYCSFLSF